MSIQTKPGLNKDLEFIASRGLADLTREGLAPSTTDSMLEAGAESDADSIGEDTNSPEAYGNQPETGLPSAEGMQMTKKGKGYSGGKVTP